MRHLLFFSAFLLFTISSHGVALKKGTPPEKTSKSKAVNSKDQNRKPTSNVMGESKSDIQLILNQYQDQEGAYVQLIKKMPNSTYKVDIKSIQGHCIGHRFQISQVQNAKTISLLSRVYECD